MYFSGRIQRVVYSNPPFYILSVLLDEEHAPATGRLAVVRGDILGFQPGADAWFGFEGEWVRDPKYGMQIKVHRAPCIEGSWSTQTAVETLANHGVAREDLGKLEAAFGDRLVEVLDQHDPEALSGAGLGKAVVDRVLDRWRFVKASFRTLEFLFQSGLPTKRIQQIWSYFGEDAEAVLAENPWLIVQIPGVTFDQADEVAQRLGCSLDHPGRVGGALLYALVLGASRGHLFLDATSLVQEVAKMISDVDAERVLKWAVDFHEQDLVVIDRETRDGLTAIYHARSYEMEAESAHMLVERQESARLTGDRLAVFLSGLANVGPEAEKAYKNGSGLREVARAALDDWSAGSHLALSDDQLQGALNALVEPVSILTGLPGTGKSTTLRSVVRILQDAKVRVLLLAPTGIAAKRLNALTGAPAYTVHKAFGAKGDWGDDEDQASYVGVTGRSSNVDDVFSMSEVWSDEPRNADVIIVDEMSMVDQHLLYRILRNTMPEARLVLVGDAAQLPSVGPGNVLRDLIQSKCIPTVGLKDIFRQESTSGIVPAAHDIYSGRVPDQNKDFVFIKKDSDSEILDTILHVVQRLYDANRDRDTPVTFQVLSPRHRGELGVTNLNSRIRTMLNPKFSGLREFRVGSDVIREGDRVMVVKNNYTLGVYNGDVGKVARVDRGYVEVKIHGPPASLVRFSFKEAPSYLRLAYCQTVHKMQGQEVDVILMPLVKSFRHQLQRNLLYTAVTRARKKVFLVGHPEALRMAVFNARQESRNTLLADRVIALSQQPCAAMR